MTTKDTQPVGKFIQVGGLRGGPQRFKFEILNGYTPKNGDEFYLHPASPSAPVWQTKQSFENIEELVPLPDHPDPMAMQWTKSELKAIAKYGQACAEAARQPAPVVAGCEFCGSAIGHDLDCQNHPVNVKAPFQQDDEHKAFMATYLYAARKASDNTSAGMILWHANRHWNGKAGEMWRARAALAATAAPVLSDERIDWLANCACPGGTAYPSQVKAAIRDALREASINRSQP